MPSQVDLLHQTSKIVSSGLTLDEMLRELIRLAVQVTACDACLIYLAEPEGDVVLRASQLPHTNEIGHIRIKLGEGVTGWVAEHKSAAALASKAAADKRFKKFPALIEDTYEAFLSVPLVSAGDVIGVIRIDISANVAWLRRVAIREDLQRVGHGRVLLRLVEAFAKVEGCNEVRSNAAVEAVGFYERCGYVRNPAAPAPSNSVSVWKVL